LSNANTSLAANICYKYSLGCYSYIQDQPL